MSDLPFEWPVLGFGVDRGPWSDFLVSFSNADEFNRCVGDSLAKGYRMGMVLVDSSAASWEITAIRKFEALGPLWLRILRILTRQPVYRIGVDFVDREPMPLPLVKERVVATMEAQSHLWVDDEGVAGEAGPPVSERKRLDKLQDRVRRSRNLSGVIKNAEVEVAE